MYSIGLYIGIYAGTILFWMLSVCSKFENRKNESSSFVILLLMSFRKGYSISWKKAIGILKGISPDNLWEVILPANVAWGP